MRTYVSTFLFLTGASNIVYIFSVNELTLTCIVVINKPVAFFAFRETEEPATENEKNVAAEKPDPEKQSGEEDAGDVKKENPVNEPEEKEPENKVSIFLGVFLFPNLKEITPA